MDFDVQKLLLELRERRYYGALELKFEGGRVVLIRKTETIKPDSGYQNNWGGQHAGQH